MSDKKRQALDRARRKIPIYQSTPFQTTGADIGKGELELIPHR